MSLRDDLFEALRTLPRLDDVEGRKAFLTQCGDQAIVSRFDLSGSQNRFAWEVIRVLGEQGQAGMVGFLAGAVNFPEVKDSLDWRRKLAGIRQRIADLSKDDWANEFAHPTLTAQQRRNYLDLLTQAYPWQGLYVPPAAVRLKHPPEERPTPGLPGDEDDDFDDGLASFEPPSRRFVHVYQQMSQLQREPLPAEMPLLAWFQALEKPYLAVLAVPGCGKSTALQEMTSRLAYQLLDAWTATSQLPLLISLGDFREGLTLGEWLRPGARQELIRALKVCSELPREQRESAAIDIVDRNFEPFAGHLDALRRNGKFVLVLDGLNELRFGVDGKLREAVNQFIADSRAWGSQIVIACRVADYGDAFANFTRVELLPFDDERIYEAVRSHLARLKREQEVEPVLRQLRENARLREVLQVPLYVRLLCLTLGDGSGRHDPGGRLPANRGELLERFTWRLLKGEIRKACKAAQPTASLEVLHNALAETAYRMRHDLASHGSTCNLSDILGFLAGPLKAGDLLADDALDLIEGAGPLTVDRGDGKIGFWKEPIEEVLAGRHMLTLFEPGKVAECQDLWRVPRARGEVPPAADRERVGPPEHPNTTGAWEETTILAAGMAGGSASLVSADDFVTAVLAVNPHLAGRCLHEGGAIVGADVETAVKSRLLEVMQDRDSSVRVRVPCGVLLGRLGDPRFHGQELFCLPAGEPLGFVKVPAGDFVMGSDDDTVKHWNRQASEEWYNDEMPQQHNQPLPYDYWIGRYPVTNAQYRCFVEDDGYQSNRFSDLWGDWERDLRKDGPDAGYWADPRYNPPSQPVVGVTWYEANAYANWLHRKLLHLPGAEHPEVAALRDLLARGGRVRLASEPEWEKAARGGLQIPGPGGRLVRNPQPGRQWPWEGEWDAARCNTWEGDEPVRWLSPAGLYPDGASPYGCLDMVGNVWELTVPFDASAPVTYGCQDMFGNVWEWTRGQYGGSYLYSADEKGRRQREDRERIGLPAVRGGSWDDRQWLARCPVRLRVNPDFMYNYGLGLRIVVSLSDAGS